MLNIDSDIKMDASQTCDQVLQFIKKSNLNYYLSESAFSVSIEIQKTFISNKDGSFRVSKLENSLLDQQNFLYEQIKTLKCENAFLRSEIKPSEYKIKKIPSPIYP